MPTAAILPVKRFEHAKGRMSARLGAGSRVALASAMFSDVLSALDRSRAVDTVVLVSGEPMIRDLVLEQEVILIQDSADKGQSQAALTGLARASALGFERAALVPADCPLIDPTELDRLIEQQTESSTDLVIVPDRHREGTNALLLSPDGPFEPEFGAGSLKRHVEQAERRGLRYSVEEVPSLALDLDTEQDMSELADRLGRSHGRAPRTQGALRQIERSRQRPPVAA